APVSRPRPERNPGQHRRANAVAHGEEAVAAMDLGPHRTTFARSVVFERLAPRDLELVLDVTQTIDASPGQVILTEGTPGDGVYVGLEGQVEIFLPERGVGGIRRPSRVGLNRLGPGRCFGEYGALDDQPSSASASAIGPAKLAFVPKAAFRRVLDEYDTLGR